MDEFGIGTALKACITIVGLTGSNSQRINRLIKQYQPDEVVVCATPQAADAMKRAGKLKGIVINTVVCDPGQPRNLMQIHRELAPVILRLDPGWLQLFYERQVDRAISDVDRIQEWISAPDPVEWL
ncbi:MAG: hypothetical protein JJ902_05280 [Roseibium sp.]|nr:hypothetical protein [Roseibium sp.]